MSKEIEAFFNTLVEAATAEAERRILEKLSLTASLTPDQTLEFKQAVEYLHISESALRRLCREKRIPHRQNGAEGSKNPRYLFSSNSLDRWKREQEEANYKPISR